MHLTSLLWCRRVVDRGPYKRVPERDSRAHVQQTFVGNRIGGSAGDTEFRGGAPHESGISRRLGRGNEEKAAGLRRQTRKSPAKARLDTAGRGNRDRECEASIQLA